MAMLVARSASSRNGGTGRMSSKIVPNNPTMSHKSPWRKRRLNCDGTAGILRNQLISFGVVPVTVDAIDPRENFSYRRVELRRNFRADFAVLEHETRQRLVLYHRDLMLLRDLADAERI